MPARAILCILLALLTTLPMVGCMEDKVTMETYEQINPGMRLDEVESLMGGSGEREVVSGMSISGAGVGFTSTSSAQVWVWSKGQKQISVTVVDGKVTTKGMSGL